MRQRTTINVDDLLWRRFKSLLALEAKEMSSVIEELVQEYIDANEAAAQESARRPRRGPDHGEVLTTS
jgi:metal-responsive CopG/Arc/MetJ family transcriptional regulator